MIRVTGEVTLKVPYSLNINMSEEEWDALSERKQDQIIGDSIGYEETKSAEVSYVDVDDVISIEDIQ